MDRTREEDTDLHKNKMGALMQIKGERQAVKGSTGTGRSVRLRNQQSKQKTHVLCGQAQSLGGKKAKKQKNRKTRQQQKRPFSYSFQIFKSHISLHHTRDRIEKREG